MRKKVKTLHVRIAAFERKLQRKAAFLDGERRSCDDHVHWKVRGSQEALRGVSHSLRAMRRARRSPFTLHIALQDYLQYIETSQEVTSWDGVRLPRPRRGMPIARWKTEGEILVLSQICPELADILQSYLKVSRGPNNPVSSKQRRGSKCRLRKRSGEKSAHQWDA
jgi:hypothetical protein